MEMIPYFTLWFPNLSMQQNHLKSTYKHRFWAPRLGDFRLVGLVWAPGTRISGSTPSNPNADGTLRNTDSETAEKQPPGVEETPVNSHAFGNLQLHTDACWQLAWKEKFNFFTSLIPSFTKLPALELPWSISGDFKNYMPKIYL